MLIAIIIGLFGLCMGSFVNALVWRIHEKYPDLDLEVEAGKKKRPAAKNLSVWKGRSQCPKCGHQLSALDLVPFLSWLWLRGRCRYCAKPISWQYPVVELATALTFLVSYVSWPSGVVTLGDWLLFSTWLLTAVGLMALFVYDLRWMLLPNRILYPTLLIAATGRLLYIAILAAQPLRLLLLWLLSVAVASGFFWLLYQISRGRWIGYGDVRLGLITGTVLAKPELSGLMILLSAVIGSIIITPLLLSGHKHLTDKIPFGPFLLLGTFISLLYGESIIDWYRGLLH